jgi:hypothetical protein
MSAFEEFLRENPKMADQPLSVVSAFETAGGFRVGRISGSS